ncbi:MAG: MaoC/PaaZ C-terminal domain-containing protein [Methylocystaceae bacterium]
MPNKLEKINNYGHPGTFAYKRFFYRSAIIGVLRPHRVVFSHRRYGQDSNFRFHPRGRKNWYRLFNVPEDMTVPFTYYDYSRAVGLMKVIEGLGVNFRYLMHLKSEFWFYHPLVLGDQYTIDYIFEDVRQIKKDKGAIVGYSGIRQADKVFQETRDHFVIKAVPEKYMTHLLPDETNQFKSLTRLPAEPLVGCQKQEINIPSDLAKKYSKASGDYNIVHTSPRLARYFGYDRPFIQGLCTANLILRELVMAGISLDYFAITFCRPVYMPSRVTLLFTPFEFRLQDEEDHILCFGSLNNGTQLKMVELQSS